MRSMTFRSTRGTFHLILGTITAATVIALSATDAPAQRMCNRGGGGQGSGGMPGGGNGGGGAEIMRGGPGGIMRIGDMMGSMQAVQQMQQARMMRRQAMFAVVQQQRQRHAEMLRLQQEQWQRRQELLRQVREDRRERIRERRRAGRG